MIEGIDDLRFSLLHPERRDLYRTDVLIFVDDQPTELIAFCTDESIGRGIRKEFLSEQLSRVDSAIEKIGINRFSGPGEESDGDF